MDKLVIYTFNISIAIGITNSVILTLSYINKYKVILPYLGIFITDKYFTSKTNETHSQIIVNTIHAFTTSFFSILYIVKYVEDWLYREILIISFSYFIYDLVYLIYSNSKIKNQSIFHHILISINLLPVFFETLMSVDNYYELTSILYLSEITTIPLNISWILNSININKYLSYSIATTIILFIPCRLFISTYIAVKVFNNILFIPALMFIFINYFWFYKLILKYIEVSKKND